MSFVIPVYCFPQLGLHGYTAYSSSKYALRGLAETLNMEVAHHNVLVSISFPPDTNTPQLQAELGERDPIQKELASFGKVFEPESIARDIWEGVERRRFQITHGFDGFILGITTSGMSPVHCYWDAIVQVNYRLLSAWAHTIILEYTMHEITATPL